MPLLHEYRVNKGFVPKNIQRTFIYFAVQYMRKILANPNILNFLSDSERKEFKDYFYSCFNFIDKNEIMRFRINGFNFFYKFGMIEGIKKDLSQFLVIYIEDIDFELNQLSFKYYSTKEDEQINISVDDGDVVPFSIKKHCVKFVDENIFYEKRVVFNFNNESDVLRFNDKYENYLINVGGREFNNKLSLLSLRKSFYKNTSFIDKNVWLFVDKETNADDNAEHLYRYMKESEKNEEIYYALSKKSPDWGRLEQEGFNLVEFNSPDFKRIYKRSYMILSSHADKYLLEYMGKDSLDGKKFVFLQHGVTKDNISDWLNNVNKIDYLISATAQEYLYFVGENSPYKFHKGKTFFTGFPRHDRLLEKAKSKIGSKEILFMPTWRNNIVGSIKQGSAKRSINQDFINSTYYKSWYKIFHDPRLEILVKKYGFSINLVMHPNVEDYIGLFDLPEFIQVDSVKKSYQEYFIDSCFLVTDYSSVAFDMAYLNKPTIYYQFDADEIFGGSHTYKKGYFDYELDGFGPVVNNEDDFYIQFESLIKCKGVPSNIYLNRMDETFIYRDGLNCERIYSSLVNGCRGQADVDISILLKYIDNAFLMKDYKTLKTRVEKIICYPELDQSIRSDVLCKMAEAYLNLKEYDLLEELLKGYDNEYYKVLLLANQKKWIEVIDIIGVELVEDQYFELRLSALFNVGNYESINFFLNVNELKIENIDDSLLLSCYYYFANENWSKLVLMMEKIQNLKTGEIIFAEYNQDDLAYMHLLASNHLKQYDLNRIMKLKSRNIQIILQKSFILSQLMKYKEALSGFQEVENKLGIDAFKEDMLFAYVQCMVEEKQWNILGEKLPQCISIYPEQEYFKEQYMVVLGKLNHWEKLVDFVDNCSSEITSKNVQDVVLAYYRIGDINQAYQILEKPTIKFDYDYWLLALEIYLQTENSNEAIHCLKQMYAIYPEHRAKVKAKFDELSQLFVF